MGSVIDLSDEMKEKIDNLSKKTEELRENDDVLSAAAHNNRQKIDMLSKNVETVSNDVVSYNSKINILEEKINTITEENHRLKNAVDALLSLKVCVPYEEGYLRAIGATRIMSLYDVWQQNVNKS